MIDHTCVPYKRKFLYLAITLPLLGLYVVLAVFLWRVRPIYAGVYVSMFVFVALSMSFVCVYWECPYVGKFAPCVGGFCLPSSQLARLFKKVKKTQTRYKIFLNLAYTFFFGIILFPIYFLFRQSIWYLLGYMGVIVVYWLVFMLFVCPVCATRNICPGGQMALSMWKKIEG